MKLIICLDERGGMTFLGRRQSRDAVVIEDIIKTVDENRLFVSAYSLSLFPEGYARVTDAPLETVGEKDYYFSETDDLEPLLSKANELIIYNWNRHYPADRRFDADLTALSFKPTEIFEFEGKSHKKIKKETYIK